MKSNVNLVTVMSVLFFIIACTKDKDKTRISHDADGMMTIMHEMDQKMDTMTMTKDIDQDFSTMMMMHHQIAIDMAKEELKSGKDTTLKQMAQTMIDAQTKEIGVLMAFVNGHTKVPHNINDEQDMKLTMTMQSMARQADLELFTGDIDNDFATLMIPHHQSAINMAEIEVHYGHDTVPVNLAASIKTDQQKEINDLQKWLVNHRN